MNDSRSPLDDLPGFTSHDVSHVSHMAQANGGRGSSRDTAGTSGDSTCPGTVSRDELHIRRPAFVTRITASRFGPAGLYFHGVRAPKGGGNAEEHDEWVCTPLDCEAMTHDERDGNHGLLLRFQSASGAWHIWSMPLETLAGSGEEMRRNLLSMGVRINPDAHRLLTRFLMGQRPKERVTAATRMGWHRTNDGRVFVMPSETIGAGEQRITFQSEHVGIGDFITRGSLADWRDSIGRLCSGNPLLILSVSTALAGPLLDLVGRTSVGVHLCGDSSCGKTTALEVAGSVWGGPDFKRTWNGTGNGLEAVAAALNDTLIILDEISEADARTVGNTVYMLGNGAGKARAARTGMARQPQRWRIAMLSSGERTLAAHMREGGQTPKAGQAVRLVDIPAKRKHGLFDELHTLSDGRAFADHLKAQVARCYGTLGPQFIENLVLDETDISGEVERFAQLPGFSASSQMQGRAAKALVLIGLAGELATGYGLTGWGAGEAMRAAEVAFDSWKSGQGESASEHEQILASIQSFIERHGCSRFSDIESGDPSAIVVRDRAGYWRRDGDGRIYLFNKSGLMEALGGFDLRRGVDSLEAAGWLAEREGKARSIRARVNGDRLRLYAVRPVNEGGNDES